MRGNNFFSQLTKNHLVEILSVSNGLESKQRRLLFDKLSSQEGKTRNVLFNIIGFDSLKHRYINQFERQIELNLFDIHNARSNI